MGYGIRLIPALAVFLLGAATPYAHAFEGESESGRYGGTRFDATDSNPSAYGDSDGEGAGVLPAYAPEAAAGVRHKTASFLRRITRWGPADLSNILTNRAPSVPGAATDGVRVSYYQPTADSRYDNYFEPQEISAGAASALFGSAQTGAYPSANAGYPTTGHVTTFKLPAAAPGYETISFNNGTFTGAGSSFGSYLSGGGRQIAMATIQPNGPLHRSGRVARSSGFFVNPNMILTNAHAVRNCNSIVINDQFEAGRTRVISVDRGRDVALLQTPMKNDTWPEIVSSDDMPSEGENIEVAGYPTEFMTEAAYQQFGAELVRGYTPGSQRIQFSKGVRKGNSGGPVVISAAKVAGMVVGRVRLMYAGAAGASYTEARATGVAVPAPTMRAFLKESGVRLTRCTDSACRPSSPMDYTVKISCFK